MLAETTAQPRVIPVAGVGRPNTITLDGIAIATYWLPFTSYVMGELLIGFGTVKTYVHNSVPVAASVAEKPPTSSPKNTTPPAVASTPPKLLAYPGCG